MLVIDTNSDCSDKIDVLRRRGVGAVGRYYSSRNPKKCLTRKEATLLSAAGIKIFPVFEDGGSPNLTAQQGRADATSALACAAAVGQPADSAIYFALEGLPNGYSNADLPAIGAYMSGVGFIIGNSFKCGVYSDGVVCDALLATAMCTYAWLSASMGFPGSKAFYQSGRWALHQTTPLDQNWDGLSVDVNEAKADFGAFLLPQASVAAVRAGRNDASHSE